MAPFVRGACPFNSPVHVERSWPIDFDFYCDIYLDIHFDFELGIDFEFDFDDHSSFKYVLIIS